TLATDVPGISILWKEKINAIANALLFESKLKENIPAAFTNVTKTATDGTSIFAKNIPNQYTISAASVTSYLIVSATTSISSKFYFSYWLKKSELTALQATGLTFNFGYKISAGGDRLSADIPFSSLAKGYV